MPVTLAELAIHFPASIDLFEKYNLDYYQNGQQTLSEASTLNHLDFREIDSELTKLQSAATRSFHFDECNILQLTDILKNKFHLKETENYRVLENRIETLLEIKAYPASIVAKLAKLKEELPKLAESLARHSEKEDRVLFPYIENLNELQQSGHSEPALKHVLSESPLEVFKLEHKQLSETMQEIKRMAGGYNSSPHFPSLYNSLLEELADYEKNLHLHLHIENNILFPKCIALEEKLKMDYI